MQVLHDFKRFPGTDVNWIIQYQAKLFAVELFMVQVIFLLSQVSLNLCNRKKERPWTFLNGPSSDMP